jgi:mono/diheme cytochrome c family protein
MKPNWPCCAVARRLLVSVVLAVFVAPAISLAEDAPRFDRDIRPILSNKCFVCHGPDAEVRQGGLRLDERAAAFEPGDSGEPAIVPGKPDESELVRRILAEDEGERMPPADSNKQLTDQEKDLLQKWIASGADWQAHWSFETPKRPEPPAVADEWAKNPIDRFIIARLQAAGLKPSPEADRTALLRRLSLDLTGLPPTPAEIDAFLADTSPEAYDKAVDRLLASPHYGERMALEWLDAARFADTHGFHLDSGRDMTAWREWVIDAFNTNKPFDRFTVEQLAGDLLPNPTLEQQIASGFNRNHMINFEGGAIPAEYHNAYLVDRVSTTNTVWLGLTMACAQCHDHKYDPLSQKEFYQFYAFFHNVPENGLDGSQGNAAPLVKVPTSEQQAKLAEVDQAIAELESRAAENATATATEKDRVDGKLTELRKEREELEKKQRTAMVMTEMPAPRDTFVLVRGQYDQHGQKVTAEVPAALPPLAKDAPRNRLGLAQWLVDPAHPLVARVIVNRYWQMYFGTGLVKTSEDFGSQGERPSHPELLDWLAREFVDSGWDVKHMQRLIVTSATYRQSSKVTPEHLATDAENRLLARGPRFRLPAEFVRDQALAVSGLLDPRIGGASVSPYQPEGLWTELSSRQDSGNWTAQVFVQSHGADLYRRTMYTFWKRTSPPPQLSTFDAPDRETCTVRRARTNTPLQALILLNDPTYVEAARKLAERMLREGGATPTEKARFAFRLCTARAPTADEERELVAAYETQKAHYASNLEQAQSLLKVGESPADAALDASELAAWTIVASVVLNLDETVTKG